jgi:hypothetical protein
VNVKLKISDWLSLCALIISIVAMLIALYGIWPPYPVESASVTASGIQKTNGTVRVNLVFRNHGNQALVVDQAFWFTHDPSEEHPQDGNIAPDEQQAPLIVPPGGESTKIITLTVKNRLAAIQKVKLSDQANQALYGLGVRLFYQAKNGSGKDLRIPYVRAIRVQTDDFTVLSGRAENVAFEMFAD